MTVRWDTAWPREVAPDRTGVEAERLVGGAEMLPGVSAWLAYGANAPRLGSAVETAQRHDESPLWELSVLPELLRDGHIVGAPHPGPASPPEGEGSPEGSLHLVGHYRLESDRTLTLACGAGLSERDAQASLDDALEGDPEARSAASWRLYFAGVPRFESDDLFFEGAYWNRWFGLRLNTVDLPGYRFQRRSGGRRAVRHGGDRVLPELRNVLGPGPPSGSGLDARPAPRGRHPRQPRGSSAGRRLVSRPQLRRPPVARLLSRRLRDAASVSFCALQPGGGGPPAPRRPAPLRRLPAPSPNPVEGPSGADAVRRVRPERDGAGVHEPLSFARDAD